MNGAIADDEPLANFILESNKFTKDGVSWRQYMPCGTPCNRSVFRIGDLTKVETGRLGQTFVADARGKALLGWGQFAAQIVSQVRPLALRADEPPIRHAIIENWPDARDKQMELAQLLASEADPIRWP